MSRAFVKEDSDQPERLPDRPQSDLPNYMTPAGRAAMADSLASLEREHAELKASGEWAAGSRLPALERDIRYYRARLQSALLVEPPASAPETVIFGAAVGFVDEQEQPFHFQIVGEDEADIARGRISWSSPLARALLGKRVGDSAIWPRPAGALEIEITEIWIPPSSPARTPGPAR